MSQRRTDKTGAACAACDGGEGSPIARDPMGNNVGTASPYFEPVVYNPDPNYPQLQPLYGESPSYVNGQRISCQLDGMVIGCSSMMSLAQAGALATEVRYRGHVYQVPIVSYGIGLFGIATGYQQTGYGEGRRPILQLDWRNIISLPIRYQELNINE